MTKHFMENLSFSFVMDLYRIKLLAEKRGDAKAVESLNQHYPELFSQEFEEIVEKTKLIAQYLDQKYGENFSGMFGFDNVDHKKNSIN